MKQWQKRFQGQHSRRATTLIEVVIALFILAMMGLMVAAIVPASARMTRSANSYSLAASICNRKIDQIVEVGFTKIDSSTATTSQITTNLTGVGVVDNTAPTVTAVTDGNKLVYTFTNNNTATNTNNPDNLSGYFPNGVAGTITIDPYSPSKRSINTVNQITMLRVTVSLSWRDANAPVQSYTMSTLISRMSGN